MSANSGESLSEAPSRDTAKDEARIGDAADKNGVPTEFEAAGALPQAVKIVASVAGPTAILTGLMFYFGLLYAVGYFRYFGVNYTVLELPAQDYFILSADSAIIPVAICASAALFGLWIYQLPLQGLREQPRQLMRRVLMPALIAVGALLVGWATADAISGAGLFPEGFWEARGLSLTLGMLLILYGYRLRRLLTPTKSRLGDRRAPDAVIVGKWVTFTIVMSIGLFWAVGSYGIGVGTGAAQGIASDLRCQPDVIVYSGKSLNLSTAGVTEEKASGDTEFAFRYTGLKLIPQSGSRYLLLPSRWVRTKSPAILLPRSDAVRLEFIPVGGTPSAPC